MNLRHVNPRESVNFRDSVLQSDVPPPLPEPPKQKRVTVEQIILEGNEHDDNLGSDHSTQTIRHSQHYLDGAVGHYRHASNETVSHSHQVTTFTHILYFPFRVLIG